MPTYLICDIVENHDAIDSSIVGKSDSGPEPLLTSAVPLYNVQCHILS